MKDLTPLLAVSRANGMKLLKFIARGIHHITFAVLLILALLLVYWQLGGMVKEYKYNQIAALTTQEAKLKKYAFRLGDIDFDVPMLYAPDNQYYGAKWTVPGTERKAESFWVVALLPDMDYFNEKTAREFAKFGYGEKVKIYVAYQPPAPNWPHYFAGAYQDLIKQPEHPLVPGMFHYRDPMTDMADVFLSHDQPVSDLIQMICDNPELTRFPVPKCEIATRYRNQFYLIYMFAPNYMGKWRDIDRKVKALLDSFIIKPITP